MPSTIPWYHRSLDFEGLWREFPPAPDYLKTVYALPRADLRTLQNERFVRQVQRAWEIPFYQRHWGNAGIKRGEIRSLEDLRHIPAFSVHDLRDSIERSPPWGDLIGIDPKIDDPVPLILQTSGGTTGLPRAMIYTPRDREVMNINTARRMYMQGVRPFDRVQVGTGNQTPSRRQVEIMRAWGINFFAAIAPYLRHVGNVARDELNFDVRELKLKGLLCWLGVDDRKPIEEQ
jgi:phenylacetate-CoA ligase